MKAYDSMAKIEKLLHGENENSEKWSKVSEQLREKIREEYWNDEAGRSSPAGPKGSEAYEKQIWETSGEEAALWDKFQIATPKAAKRNPEQWNTYCNDTIWNPLVPSQERA